MSINDLIASIGDKHMNRKDFLKVGVFAMASIVGIKSIINLLAGVELQPDLTVTRKSETGDQEGGGFNKGRYNR